jgi:hypothetical protein
MDAKDPRTWKAFVRRSSTTIEKGQDETNGKDLRMREEEDTGHPTLDRAPTANSVDNDQFDQGPSNEKGR